VQPLQLARAPVVGTEVAVTTINAPVI